MSMVIGTNVASLTAQRHLASSQNDMATSMERLASGSRINSAMDDAAGLAIRDRMTAQVEGMNQAVRNANDGIAMLQTAEGGLEETTDILLRMRELAVQASSDSYNSDDRASLDLEFEQLKDEIDRIAANTKFNGTAVLSSTGNANFQVGDANGDSISVTWQTMTTSTLGSTDATVTETGDLGAYTAASTSQVHTFGEDVDSGERVQFTINGNTYSQDYTEVDAAGDADAIAANNTATWNLLAAKIVAGEDGVSAAVYADGAGTFTLTVTAGTAAGQASIINGGGMTGDDISSSANALTAIDSIDAALLEVDNYRATLGSKANRLEHTVDNLMNRAENTAAAKSRISDTDFAQESANLAKAQVLQQAGTAMLAQANASTQNVLSLLK